VEKIVDSCLREMKVNQFRITPQREALLWTLVKEKDNHFTPYQLFEKAKETCPELGLATVYRSLAIFAKLGLVREIQLKKGLTHYEFIGPKGKRQHYHLICKKCGRVEELDGLPSRRFLDEVDRRIGFLITDYSCQFYGYCSKCRPQGNQNKEKTEEKKVSEKGRC